MAEFVAPQFQNPDFLAAALKGQALGQNAAAFPGQMALQGQQVQSGQLNLQQLQMAMKFQQMKQDVLSRALDAGNQPGTQSTQTGQQPGGGTMGNAVDLQGGAEGGTDGIENGGTYGYAPTNLSPGSLRAIGMLAPEMLRGMQEGDAAALHKAQITSQLQGSPLMVVQAFAGNPNAADALAQPQNSSWLARWPMLARKWGFDPKVMSNINVQMAATLEANQQRAQLQLPPLKMPAGYRDVEGPYGEHSQVQIGGETPGKETEVTPQKPPTYAPEIGYNPKTGQKNATMLQTSPGGQTSGLAGNGGGRSTGTAGGANGVGGVVGTPTDIGFKEPTDPERKAAMFGSEMYSGLKTVQRLEDKGIKLPPALRTNMLDAAASDNDGVIHQFMSQEGLLHSLTPDQQTYFQALMPILQAFGHSQAGAKVSYGQMRTNFEGIVPIDPSNKEDRQQVDETRRGFYVGALSQAGSALQLPEYAKLKFELSKAQAAAKGNKPAPYSDADKEARYQAWKKANNR